MHISTIEAVARQRSDELAHAARVHVERAYTAPASTSVSTIHGVEPTDAPAGRWHWRIRWPHARGHGPARLAGA